MSRISPERYKHLMSKSTVGQLILIDDLDSRPAGKPELLSELLKRKQALVELAKFKRREQAQAYPIAGEGPQRKQGAAPPNLTNRGRRVKYPKSRALASNLLTDGEKDRVVYRKCKEKYPDEATKLPKLESFIRNVRRLIRTKRTKSILS